MTTATAPAPNRALATAPPSSADVTDILRKMGILEAPRSDFHRVKVDGTIFYFGDEPFVTNPKSGAPAFTARIIDSPEEYQALFMDAEHANYVGRPHMAGKFCKSHFDIPSQNRDFAEDGTSCRQCPLMPFKKAADIPAGLKKCQWKGDLQLQLVDAATGKLADETIWTLTLPTTAMIEWKGTAKEGMKGSISDQNTMHKLALLGATSNPEDPQTGIRDAVNALALGAIIAEFRALRAESNGHNYTVISVTPIAILDITDAHQDLALPADTGTDEDVPF